MATSASVVPVSASGEFQRPNSTFRNWISKEPGSEFVPAKDRYHLYISHACPWANRTTIVRHLKGLGDIVTVTSVHHHSGAKGTTDQNREESLIRAPSESTLTCRETGWKFATTEEEIPELNVTRDPLHHGYEYLSEVYHAEQPDYNGRFSVPLLYDKVAKKIVNNESEDIIRMLNHVFDDLIEDSYRDMDFYPSGMKKLIDEANKWIYDDINNGVYKTGFAQ